jgi:tetratricopeptide (TPR) repeat protein
MSALELYALGDPEVIKMVAEPRAIGSISAALLKDGSAWIRANGASEVAHRRLVAVTFALEAVRHVPFDDRIEFASADSLLRWASGELRQEPKPSEGERLWRRGVIAVLQGAGALNWVDRELNVAKSRFPSEPRWLLVQAWRADLGGIRMERTAPLEGVIELPPSVVHAYEDAMRAPETRAEAATRLAYLRCAAGQVDSAIELSTQGATLTTEPDIRALAHLIHGWALTRGGRPAEALAEFRLAHESLPASQSAALWLARSLFLEGQRADAEALADETTRTGLEELDPFKVYLRGDFRLWPGIIAALREAIR